MSRCGSTLFTQMLGVSDNFFVLSEPTIINAILDPAVNIDPDTKKSLLKTCFGVLDSCAPITSKKTIIKFRSWNILFINLIPDCYEKVPWLFIHRNGIEVLASVIERPPGWLRSKKLYSNYFSGILNIDSDQIINMSLSEFCSRLLGIFCINARKYHSSQTRFLDYCKIKTDFFDIIRVLWNIELSKEEKGNVLKVSDLYSKDLKEKRVFISDSDTKQKQITDKQKIIVLDLVESERSKLIKI